MADIYVFLDGGQPNRSKQKSRNVKQLMSAGILTCHTICICDCQCGWYL